MPQTPLKKENRLYQKAVRASLQRDWAKRRSEKESQPKIQWSPQSRSSTKPWASSGCYKNKKEPFSNFQIERPLLYIVGDVSTEVFYCPQENRYWIYECSGSTPSSCRSTGPIDFNPQTDPLFQNQIAGLKENS